MEETRFARVTKSTPGVPPPGKLAPGRMIFAVTSQRSSFDPLGAGALLAGVLFACVGLGAVLGWAAGSTGIGVAIGAVIGVPASILAVYLRYRSAF